MMKDEQLEQVFLGEFDKASAGLDDGDDSDAKRKRRRRLLMAALGAGAGGLGAYALYKALKGRAPTVGTEMAPPDDPMQSTNVLATAPSFDVTNAPPGVEDPGLTKQQQLEQAWAEGFSKAAQGMSDQQRMNLATNIGQATGTKVTGNLPTGTLSPGLAEHIKAKHKDVKPAAGPKLKTRTTELNQLISGS